MKSPPQFQIQDSHRENTSCTKGQMKGAVGCDHKLQVKRKKAKVLLHPLITFHSLMLCCLTAVQLSGFQLTLKTIHSITYLTPKGVMHFLWTETNRVSGSTEQCII